MTDHPRTPAGPNPWTSALGAAASASSALLASPLAAAVAVVGAASSLTGVINGFWWFVFVVLAVSVVTGTGLVLRSLGRSVLLVALGQLVALLCMLTAAFTDSGVLWMLPGPAAIVDLQHLLTQSVEQVQTGIPPVAASDPIVCLIVMATGLVAVLVDTLVVTLGTPAASGLVLLCVFAIPASLTDKLLPWWTFVLGTGGFAALLAVDRRQQQRRWRGLSGLPSKLARTTSWPAAAAVASVALLLALASGSWLTVVGTSGRLPNFARGAGSSGGLGLKPFTSLRGMLEQKTSVDLFKVHNLSNPTYLRVMTLRKFNRNEGWVLDGLNQGVLANSQLPLPPGSPETVQGRAATIDIEPTGYRDAWLPTYGVPRTLDGISDQWHYDSSAGIVFTTTDRLQRAGRYTEQALFPEPTIEQLRAANGVPVIDPAYLELNVDQRVIALAQDITARATTNFDKAYALNHYFADPTNGFTYSTQTAPPITQDGLIDFLFTGKHGYCEQYASAMAVLLRAVGVPSRVVLGFTAGYDGGGYRVITTSDAHAWVEGYFPGIGWTTFDPTPLADGRAVLPAYLTGQPRPGNASQLPDRGLDRPSINSAERPTTTRSTPMNDASHLSSSQAKQDATPAWLAWTFLVTLGLATALSLLRLARRHITPAVPADGVRADTGGRKADLRTALSAVGGWFLRFAGYTAAAAWALVVLLAAALLWPGLVVLLTLAGVTGTPVMVRAVQRRQRLSAASAGGPGAADAAWAEVLAESWDRGTTVAASDTVRGAARRLVGEHDLDERGRAGLRLLISAVERDWYAHDSGQDIPRPSGTTGELSAALEEVRRSLDRTAPLRLRARLLPRSVLHPTGARTSDH